MPPETVRLRSECPMNTLPEMDMLNLSGQRFGRWTVTTEGPRRGKYVRRWSCRCDCGGEGLVSQSNLLRGVSKSCGCLMRDVTAARNRASAKHGHASNAAGNKPSPTYRSWVAMMVRCTWKKHPAYDRYGGAGIKVCERWQDFSLFLADMGERPGLDRSLDRIDGTLGYEPGNVRWATRSEQNRNRKPRSEWKNGGRRKAA